jgi:hypothetical protein
MNQVKPIPNYRALMGVGITFIAAGIATDVDGLMAVGFIFIILGIVKRNGDGESNR